MQGEPVSQHGKLPPVLGFLKILPLQNLPRVFPGNVGCLPGGPNLNFVPPIVAPWEAMDRYWRRIDASIHRKETNFKLQKTVCEKKFEYTNFRMIRYIYIYSLMSY